MFCVIFTLWNLMDFEWTLFYDFRIDFIENLSYWKFVMLCVNLQISFADLTFWNVRIM